MATARAVGWFGGVRTGAIVYDEARPLALLDVHWERYDWARHVALCRQERPALAVVPDTMTLADLPRTLAQAEELAPHVAEAVLVVPKCSGLIAQLPRCVGGRPVRLAYSVPTRYGGVGAVPIWEFGGWPAHLLGGSPRQQIACAHYLAVRSADGNMCHRIAQRGVVFCLDGSRRTVQDLDGTRWHDDAGLPYEALRRSLVNIPLLWRRAGFRTTIDVAA